MKEITRNDMAEDLSKLLGYSVEYCEDIIDALKKVRHVTINDNTDRKSLLRAMKGIGG